jgi:exonuclease SbcD
MDSKLSFMHIADLHIGKSNSCILGTDLSKYRRSKEIRLVLSDIVSKIKENNIDVLLISGDIFQNQQISSEDERIFIDFIRDSIKANESIKIFGISGNHDKGQKFETIKHYLGSFTGQIHFLNDIPVILEEDKKVIDLTQMVYPITNAQNDIVSYVVLIPYFQSLDSSIVKFLMNQLEISSEEELDGTDGLVQSEISKHMKLLNSYIVKSINEIYKQTNSTTKQCPPIIALAHCSVYGTNVSDDLEKNKSLASYLNDIGGVESISSNSLKMYDYVALGHIHKSYRVQDETNIYYSGSIFCNGFNELKYSHNANLFDVVKDNRNENSNICIDNIRQDKLNRVVEFKIIPDIEGVEVDCLEDVLIEAIKEQKQKCESLNSFDEELRPFIKIIIKGSCDNEDFAIRSKVNDLILKMIEKNDLHRFFRIVSWEFNKDYQKQLEDKQLAYKELNLDESYIDDPLKMFEMFIDKFPQEDKFKEDEKIKILNLLSLVRDDKDMNLTSLVTKKDNLQIDKQALLDSIFGDENENN